jgi:hypothetical protein
MITKEIHSGISITPQYACWCTNILHVALDQLPLREQHHQEEVGRDRVKRFPLPCRLAPFQVMCWIWDEEFIKGEAPSDHPEFKVACRANVGARAAVKCEAVHSSRNITDEQPKHLTPLEARAAAPPPDRPRYGWSDRASGTALTKTCCMQRSKKAGNAAPVAVRAFCHGRPKNQTMARACPAIRGKPFFLSVNYLTLLNRFLNDAARA